MSDDNLRAQLSGLFRNDDGVNDFTPPIVGDTNYRTLQDPGASFNDRLDLTRVDIHTSRYDHVLFPIANVEVTILIEVCDVT